MKKLQIISKRKIKTHPKDQHTEVSAPTMSIHRRVCSAHFLIPSSV
jgi:hypothetical protein